ncbi:OmpW family outer membrane protein [Pseudomonas aeruginosa]|uniref:OmpW family outer membrane protein n=1 Tax=Pseudomonas aeruginosa TaxID=287 RepID=UPI0008FB4E2C|nr:OmpW family outer membrane protein [Pseudomonas aeruginosa]UFK74875.1 hypothetical protein K0E51_12405 [Pseudomonas aeruginosa SG17M]WCW39206.1 hypothetical protein KK209_11370 [Pseudomonas aeruginosa]
MQGLDVDNSWGKFIQVGAEFWADEKYGVFVDLKKFDLEAESSGTLNGIPVTAEKTLDPLVFHTGLVVKF